MPECFISIGSNINKEANIASSLKALKQQFGKLTISSIYETEAVGFVGDNFLNLVVGFNTELNIKNVAHTLRRIEQDHGRTRNSKKFSARTLDLDLLLYGNQVLNEDGLQIPRNEVEHYAFVLEPLAEIAPNLKHPIHQLDYATMWRNFDKSNLKQRRINAD